ncbi:MAG: hypothetical protein J7K00_02610 [Candidatus Diapherotrites archaeon]|nr:hypothetical protein [Candidatus Diapherotrites archaeon]
MNDKEKEEIAGLIAKLRGQGESDSGTRELLYSAGFTIEDVQEVSLHMDSYSQRSRFNTGRKLIKEAALSVPGRTKRDSANAKTLKAKKWLGLLKFLLPSRSSLVNFLLFPVYFVSGILKKTVFFSDKAAVFLLSSMSSFAKAVAGSVLLVRPVYAVPVVAGQKKSGKKDFIRKAKSKTPLDPSSGPGNPARKVNKRGVLFPVVIVLLSAFLFFSATAIDFSGISEGVFGKGFSLPGVFGSDSGDFPVEEEFLHQEKSFVPQVNVMNDSVVSVPVKPLDGRLSLTDAPTSCSSTESFLFEFSGSGQVKASSFEFVVDGKHANPWIRAKSVDLFDGDKVNVGFFECVVGKSLEVSVGSEPVFYTNYLGF